MICATCRGNIEDMQPRVLMDGEVHHPACLYPPPHNWWTAPMKQTNEKPTEDAWYWRRQSYEGVPMPSCEWEMVRVRRGIDGKVEVCDPFELVDQFSCGSTYQTHAWERLGQYRIEYVYVGPLHSPEKAT